MTPAHRPLAIINPLTVEVLQREIGITHALDEKPILATTNVAMCTVFHGFNSEHRVGFLGHFDFPFTLAALPGLFDKLTKLTGAGSVYVCGLYGGNRCSWARSPKMRFMIEEHAERLSAQTGSIRIKIEHKEPFQNWKSKLAYTLDTRTGLMGPYPQMSKRLSLKSLAFIKSANFIYEPETFPRDA